MLPTQCLGLEVMMWEDPGSVVACMNSLNRWIAEEWTFNIDNRVLVTGYITLIDPQSAEAQLEVLINQGCKVIGMRPGPVKDVKPADIQKAIDDGVALLLSSQYKDGHWPYEMGDRIETREDCEVQQTSLAILARGEGLTAHARSAEYRFLSRP
jgi:hypothetical protein